MAIRRVWITMGNLLGVKVRAGGNAAIGVVSKLVDVESTLGIGIVTSDVPGNDGVGVFGGLLESDGALDIGVTTKNCDCFWEKKDDVG